MQSNSILVVSMTAHPMAREETHKYMCAGAQWTTYLTQDEVLGFIKKTIISGASDTSTGAAAAAAFVTCFLGDVRLDVRCSTLPC
jgi:hypothetical protein